MNPIRNIAQENAIRKAVGKVPGCTCHDVRQQSDYFVVSLSEYGQTRAIRVTDAAHAMRILNRQEPES